MTTVDTLRSVLEALQAAGIAKLSDGTYLDKDCKITFAITDLTAIIADMEKAEPVYFVEDDFGLFKITDEADYMYWSSTGRHKTFVANPQPKAEPNKAFALCLLSAASKSGDPGAMSLAAQLAGVAPCEKCDYVKSQCKCAQPKAEPADDDLTIAYMAGFHAGKKTKAEPAKGAQIVSTLEAEPVQEPFGVVTRFHDLGGEFDLLSPPTYRPPVGAMLYAAAPQAKPMTEQFIYNWLASENSMEDCKMSKLEDFRKVVRYVEAAHGIKGNAT